MKEVVIVAAGRTAIGQFNGSLAGIPTSVLGSTVIKGLLKKTGIGPDQVDEVILGQVLTAGCGQDPARQTVIDAGLPGNTPALTINKACGSGLKAVQMAAQAIELYDAELIIAGGQENMSLSGHYLRKSLNSATVGEGGFVDATISDGLWGAFDSSNRGSTPDYTAETCGFRREAGGGHAGAFQDEVESTLAGNRFADEIIPVVIPQGQGGAVTFDRDELSLAGATVVNPSSLSDGAAFVIVCSAEKAENLGLEPLASIKAYGTAVADPASRDTGSTWAISNALSRAGWTIDDLDLIEAFPAPSMPVNNVLEWSARSVNVNGGGIAPGHPVGASDCRILVSLLHEMVKRDADKGLATLRTGNDRGISLAVER